MPPAVSSFFFSGWEHTKGAAAVAGHMSMDLGDDPELHALMRVGARWVCSTGKHRSVGALLSPTLPSLSSVDQLATSGGATGGSTIGCYASSRAHWTWTI
jgi:hypothetical protein